MIQRTLLRQTRALGPSIRPATRSSLTRTQFQPTNQSLRAGSRPVASARWYGTETDAKKAGEGDAAAAAEGKNGENGDPVKKQLEAKDKEIVELKDRYLRSVADFRNLQERTKRDMQVAKDFAISKFAKDLVDSVDNLDRALAIVSQEKLDSQEDSEHLRDLLSMHEGLKMTESILMQTLKKHGLERFDPSVDAEPFNPNEHEATFMAPMEGKEDNTVFLTQQKGFKLNGRILRAAKVGVVKNK
ncbi:putative heat shock protein MGE1 [Venustampulla echinocandica]|uniref:GrpE protein homolog n=1 Tax=Venustampulla echinocandica TaxID=2656787 RepID=A0A370TXR7_9HELO|nr:putative heat shock protein MGE1 [Venustampulla echinocandica]RDL40317.1 putative heat shock protein MGE1 [Venustampulla echinocandica]